jgi:pimeloyl-ACP methyl ester carboxylesterase
LAFISRTFPSGTCFRDRRRRRRPNARFSPGTIGSSFLPYYDFTNSGALTWMVEAFKQWTGSSDVPTAFAIFPEDISHPPREWAERFFNVQRWTTMPRGGHFAAMEEPELLVDDIRAFFRPLRSPVTFRAETRRTDRSSATGHGTRAMNDRYS